MSLEDRGDARSRTGSGSRLIAAMVLAVGVLVVASLAGPGIDASRGAGCDFGSDCVTTVSTGGGGEEPTTYSVTVNVSGSGTVKNGTQTCPSSCTWTVVEGGSITFTGTPAAGWTGPTWGGDCATGTCSNVTSNLTVTATFVDNTPPGNATITGPQANAVWRSDKSGPLLTFNGGADATRFECRLDGQAAVGCTSGSWRPSATGLATGVKTLVVRSFDASNNFAEASVAVKFVTVPDTTLTGGPPAVTTERHTSFAYGPAADGYQCKLNGTTRACTADLDPAGLADGQYTLTAAAGTTVPNAATIEYDETPASHTWRVDTTAPNVTLTGPDSQTSSRTARFTFSGADATAISYTCQLDAQAPAPCSAPFKEYANVALGTHTFKLVAKDVVNNTAPAKTWTWKVVSDNDGDGINVPEDCNDNNAAIRPGAMEILDNDVDENCDGIKGVNLDRDGDGVLRRPTGNDCNDANAAIKPGAFDKPEDGVDQDCSGSDAKWLAPPITGGFSYMMAGKATLITKAALAGAPAGSKFRIRCAGKGCPFKTRPLPFRKGKVSANKLVRKARLRKGAVIEMRASAPNAMTKIWRLTSRAPKLPRTQTLCLKPGARKPGSCT